MTNSRWNTVPDAVRQKVLSAEECFYCGELDSNFQVDHIQPKARGGSDEIANLACACWGCNSAKRSMPLHEWIQYRLSNGMFWPPVASFANEPEHYVDMHGRSRQPGHETALKCEHYQKLYVPKRIELDANRTGYRCYYRCSTCSVIWTCGYSRSTSVYSDCYCNFCCAGRIEGAYGSPKIEGIDLLTGVWPKNQNGPKARYE